jgi:hypothetical protein
MTPRLQNHTQRTLTSSGYCDYGEHEGPGGCRQLFSSFPRMLQRRHTRPKRPFEVKPSAHTYEAESSTHLINFLMGAVLRGTLRKCCPITRKLHHPPNGDGDLNRTLSHTVLEVGFATFSLKAHFLTGLRAILDDLAALKAVKTIEACKDVGPRAIDGLAHLAKTLVASVCSRASVAEQRWELVGIPSSALPCIQKTSGFFTNMISSPASKSVVATMPLPRLDDCSTLNPWWSMT